MKNFGFKEMSHNVRVVDFKQIHNQTPEDFEKFIEIIDPQPGDVILDGMDGYGAVVKELLDATKAKGFIPEIYTLDASPVQIERARMNIPNIDSDHVVNADMRQTPFRDNMFDKVIIKMGIHEVPKHDQIKVVSEVYRILKPGGSFITWDLSFHDELSQRVFQDLIRKKDQIAGFETLVANRYFPRQDELLHLFEQAGFKRVSVAHAVDARLNMRVRESELVSKDRIALQKEKGVLSIEDELRLAELGKARCNELVAFAKQYMALVPPEIRKRISYQETEDDIKIIPNKEILVGHKL